MVKRTLAAGVFVGVFALAGLRVAAVEDSLVCGMCEKGSHGLVNMCTGWFEVPMQIYKGYQDGIGFPKYPAGDRSAGMILGVFRGATHAAGRTMWGFFQLAGFWTRNPTTNEHLLLLHDSEYAWEMGARKNLRCPELDDGINRVGMRFERGCRNIFGAPVEIAGQIKKADCERRVYVGPLKGVWFAASRVVYGVGDFAMFPLAGPEANLNVPFDEVEGWDALAGKYYNNVETK